MPLVATISSPRSTRPRAASRPTALSRSARDMNTVPESGRAPPAEICDFVKARPVVMSIPMTSPVDRISGPSTGSASGNLSNGSTASLTATWSPATRSRSSPSARNPANVAPIITRLATLASGTPVALATNGTVREARGLASIT